MARERKGPLAFPSGSARERGVSADLLARELLQSITAELGRALARGNEQAVRFQSLAEDAMNSIGDLRADEASAELFHRAHRLRGLVLNALVVLSEFQLVAGQLDTIATLRQRHESPGEGL